MSHLVAETGALPARSAARGKTYGDIQGLRALAAALVVLNHGLIILHPQADRALAGYLGELGVCVFFVISGFIMVVSTQGEAGAADAAGFIKKRIFRIVPIYWLSTILLAVINLRNGGPAGLGFGRVLTSLVFIPAPETPLGPVRPYHSPGWTLELEMVFYLLFGLAIVAPVARKSTMVIAALATIVLAGAYLRSPFDMSYRPTLATFFSDPILLLFGVGVVIAKIRLKRDSVRGRSPLPIVAGLIVAATASFWASGGAFPFSLPSVTLAWAVAAACVWLCSTAHVDAKDNWLTRLLDQCGDASYSVYLFHLFLVEILAGVWRRLLGEADTAAFLGVSLLFSFAAATLIFRTLERPIGAYLRRFA